MRRFFQPQKFDPSAYLKLLLQFSIRNFDRLLIFFLLLSHLPLVNARQKGTSAMTLLKPDEVNRLHEINRPDPANIIPIANDDPNLARIKSLRASGNNAEAYELLNDYFDLFGNQASWFNAEVLLLHGEFSYEKGNYQVAEHILLAAVELEDQSERTLVALFKLYYYWMQRELLTTTNFKRVEKKLQDVGLALQTKKIQSPEGSYCVGLYWLQRVFGQDWVDINLFEKALEKLKVGYDNGFCTEEFYRNYVEQYANLMAQRFIQADKAVNYFSKEMGEKFFQALEKGPFNERFPINERALIRLLEEGHGLIIKLNHGNGAAPVHVCLCKDPGKLYYSIYEIKILDAWHRVFSLLKFNPNNPFIKSINQQIGSDVVLENVVLGVLTRDLAVLNEQDLQGINALLAENSPAHESGAAFTETFEPYLKLFGTLVVFLISVITYIYTEIARWEYFNSLGRRKKISEIPAPEKEVIKIKRSVERFDFANKLISSFVTFLKSFLDGDFEHEIIKEQNVLALKLPGTKDGNIALKNPFLESEFQNIKDVVLARVALGKHLADALKAILSSSHAVTYKGGVITVTNAAAISSMPDNYIKLKIHEVFKSIIRASFEYQLLQLQRNAADLSARAAKLGQRMEQAAQGGSTQGISELYAKVRELSDENGSSFIDIYEKLINDKKLINKEIENLSSLLKQLALPEKAEELDKFNSSLKEKESKLESLTGAISRYEDALIHLKKAAQAFSKQLDKRAEKSKSDLQKTVYKPEKDKKKVTETPEQKAQRLEKLHQEREQEKKQKEQEAEEKRIVQQKKLDAEEKVRAAAERNRKLQEIGSDNRYVELGNALDALREALNFGADPNRSIFSDFCNKNPELKNQIAKNKDAIVSAILLLSLMRACHAMGQLLSFYKIPDAFDIEKLYEIRNRLMHGQGQVLSVPDVLKKDSEIIQKAFDQWRKKVSAVVNRFGATNRDEDMRLTYSKLHIYAEEQFAVPQSGELLTYDPVAVIKESWHFFELLGDAAVFIHRQGIDDYLSCGLLHQAMLSCLVTIGQSLRDLKISNKPAYDDFSGLMQKKDFLKMRNEKNQCFTIFEFVRGKAGHYFTGSDVFAIYELLPALTLLNVAKNCKELVGEFETWVNYFSGPLKEEYNSQPFMKGEDFPAEPSVLPSLRF